MEFGLLGYVEVRVDGCPVEVGHARQRCVIGRRSVLGGHCTFYNYLSRLRHALGPITEVDLVRQPGGYVLIVDPMVVDMYRFHHLVAQARAADDPDGLLSEIATRAHPVTLDGRLAKWNLMQLQRPARPPNGT